MIRMRKNALISTVLCLLVTGAISCGDDGGGGGDGNVGPMPAKGPAVFPGSSWQTASGSQVGLKDSGLNSGLAAAMSGSDCVAIVKDGYLVASQGSTQPRNPWSVGKSVLSSIIGIMYTNGEISSLDAPGSGSGNTIRENLEQPIDGSWDYSPTGGQSRAADIVANYGGESVGAHAKRLLFDPLGMSRSSMGSDGFMDSNCLDLARWGHLIAQDGVWDGKRLIRSDYMQESVQPVRGNSAYGYLLWLNRKGNWESTLGASGSNSKPVPNAPENMIYGKGFYGQTVIILPDSGIVAARLGSDGLLDDTIGAVRNLYDAVSRSF